MGAMDAALGTPRPRFSSALGSMGRSMGTPARRGPAPGTPSSTRRTFDRSSRGQNPLSYSTNTAISTPKNIFRASMTGDRTRPNFTPRASSTLRHAYSPAPPSSARSFRASTASAASASLHKPSSAPLFNQTIDDPPTTLDGQALVNQVPDDPTRQGSVYADEFLAHTCPPGLDELGRRQWFCILDLRRLKYAANELFAKKDWKVNIANFAKEYEKSRGLIMLRYGLYEFHTVKPTDEQLSQWRKDHDIPDPDEDATPTRRTQTGSAKRKAEEEMPLATSKSNRNKRRQTEPAEPLGKGKRRAASDSDQDENQPAKMHKTSTPSHALSAFMKAAGGTGDSKIAPSKSASTVFAGKARIRPAKSVLDDPSGASAPSPNLFEHLSDASGTPSLNNADKPDESDDADSEAGDIDGKDESEQSASASGGVGAPADREGTPSQNLFDRVQRDKDGQPMRILNVESDKPKSTSFAPPNQTWNTGTPIKFAGSSNPFGAKTSDEGAEKPAPFKPMFDSKPGEPKQVPPPAATPSSSQTMFSAATSKAPESSTAPESSKAPESESKPEAKTEAAPAPSNSLNALSKPAEMPEAPKPATTHLFGSATNTFSSGTNTFGSATNAFGSATSTQPLATAPSSTLFGSATPVNGTKAPVAATSTNGSVSESSKLFGAKPAESAEPPKSASLFGSIPAPQTEKAPSPLFGAPASTSGEKSKPLFGHSATSEAPASKVAMSAATEDDKGKSVFGTASSSNPIFGAASSITEDKGKTAAFGSTAASEAPSNKLFGGAVTDNKPAGLFAVGAANTPKPATSVFGGSSQPPSIFGGSTAPAASAFGAIAPASDASNEKSKTSFGFGGDSSKPTGSAGPSVDSKSLFGFGGNASLSTSTTFGGEKKTEAATPSASFGSSTQPQTSSKSVFGSVQNGLSTPGSSFNFSTGPVNNPFASRDGGASGANINLSFGSTTTASNPDSPFKFGGAGTSVDQSGSGFGFGSSTPATPPATSSGPPSFSFTGATPTGNSGNSNNMFAPQPSGLAAPGGTSSGTSSPFNFGGGSSLATTPGATTPEPTTAADEASSLKQPDAVKSGEEGEEKHSQISLAEGGPGEEDEEVVYDVKCKALKEELKNPEDSKDKENDKREEKKSKSVWSTKGVGPLRILKHKTTDTVRLVLRTEPRGNVVINSVPIPTMPYTCNGKYVVAAFPSEESGLDKWMLKVKTADAAKALADAINKYKKVEMSG